MYVYYGQFKKKKKKEYLALSQQLQLLAIDDDNDIFDKVFKHPFGNKNRISSFGFA